MLTRAAAVLCFIGSVALVAPARARAQQPPAPTEVGAAQLAIVTLPSRTGAKLTVLSPAFQTGGDIPFENTQYRGNVFPGLSWTVGPAGTKSYAIIMQDADAMRNGAPILHWTMFNIPATTTSLAAGMATAPNGAEFGPNIRGASQPYLGPHTPAGPKHRYHFQVFALDRDLNAVKGYSDLTAAMAGHVLASGELVALGQAAPSGTH